MNDTSNASYSLLNQKEIDALVKFLLDNKDMIDSSVMTQESIDKLISLITGEGGQFIFDCISPFLSAKDSYDFLVGLRKSSKELCELRCSVDDTTGYLVLTAHNMETGAEISITPKTLNRNDSDHWGYAVTPFFFNHLAHLLSFKYTTDTHDEICRLYAKHIFGDPEHPIPQLDMPRNHNLLDCIL